MVGCDDGADVGFVDEFEVGGGDGLVDGCIEGREEC